MERIISEEERIRRAEEISARRKNRIPVSNINRIEKPKMSLLSKVFIQVITCICIFGVIYFMNMNNSFAVDKIKPIISEDTDFVWIYNQIDEFVKNLGNSLNIDNKQDEKRQDGEGNIDNAIDINETNNNANKKEDEQNNENSVTNEANLAENEGQDNNNQGQNVENATNEQNNNQNSNEENNNESNKQENNNESNKQENNNQNENKILTDVDYIKANANIVKPISGIITSGYGEREATNIVSGNHAGVDIGANMGTDITAAMSGTVELTSEEGDYGKHLIIVNGEVSTLYAHCSKIVVKQGDYIEQGQKIAEVGSTGKSTGPHLHFEIRRNNKTVDPQQIVNL